jgi:pentatricopeptide repeat protein
MLNMGLSARIATGMGIDAAAVGALKACERHGIPPTCAQTLHNNVLSAYSKSGPPEAVLSWLARMRLSGVPVDVAACNTQLRAHAALYDLNSCVSLLTTMMRGEPGMPRPDEACTNTVILALSNARQPAKAETLLHAMMDSGLIVPSTHSCAERTAHLVSR